MTVRVVLDIYSIYYHYINKNEPWTATVDILWIQRYINFSTDDFYGWNEKYLDEQEDILLLIKQMGGGIGGTSNLNDKIYDGLFLLDFSSSSKYTHILLLY